MQHGFGSWATDDGLDEVSAGLRVDPRRRDRLVNISGVLSSLPIGDGVRAVAIRHALDFDGGDAYWKTRLAGSLGLAIGHALRLTFGSEIDAKSHGMWDDVVDVCDEIGADPDVLLTRTFDTLTTDDDAPAPAQVSAVSGPTIASD